MIGIIAVASEVYGDNPEEYALKIGPCAGSAESIKRGAKVIPGEGGIILIATHASPVSPSPALLSNLNPLCRTWSIREPKGMLVSGACGTSVFAVILGAAVAGRRYTVGTF